MRAKIIDGVFITFDNYSAQKKIQREIDGEQYTTYNPTDEMLAAQGWLLVVETPIPGDAPEGWHYEDIYTEEGGEIVQGWVLVETEYSEADAYEILFGGDVE